MIQCNDCGNKQKSHLNLFASSMKGRLSRSESNFQSAPSRFEISELCIFGFSWAIFRLWPRDQTMKAFIGRLIWSPVFGPGPIMFSWRMEPIELGPGGGSPSCLFWQNIFLSSDASSLGF